MSDENKSSDIDYMASVIDKFKNLRDDALDTEAKTIGGLLDGKEFNGLFNHNLKLFAVKGDNSSDRSFLKLMKKAKEDNGGYNGLKIQIKIIESKDYLIKLIKEVKKTCKNWGDLDIDLSEYDTSKKLYSINLTYNIVSTWRGASGTGMSGWIFIELLSNNLVKIKID